MSCKTGGSWTRPPGEVANTVSGVADCAAKCKGYKYFGLECPRATVHCQCANTLSGSNSVSDEGCKTAKGHCNEASMKGGYLMGGYGIGSVYLVKG